VIKATRKSAPNVLLLDAGNALWSTQQPAEETKGKVVIEAMNLMRYDAMALGDLDLQLGVEALSQRIAEASFPVLSANLALAGSGKLLAKPYALLNVGGRKVGVIGLAWDKAQVPPELENQVKLLGADEALQKYVPELTGKADIVVVLSNMGYEEDQRLSSLVSGIDLIVGGRTAMPLDQAWKNEQTGTLIVQAGSQGEWLGRRSLHFDTGGAVTEYKDELIYLTDEFVDDPELKAFMDKNRPQQ
jgi:2',3'-cyclic-nucleotide 2'-phosphodiesterase (5'-nucleotidase family)